MMKKIIFAAVAAIICYNPAFAGEYSTCSGEIDKQFANLIAPVYPISRSVVVSSTTNQLLVESKAGDAIVSVDVLFHSKLHKSLNANFSKYGAWISMVETTDVHGNAVLQVQVWSNTSNGCVTSILDTRAPDVYSSVLPMFWDAVSTWEQKHPEKILVDRGLLE